MTFGVLLLMGLLRTFINLIALCIWLAIFLWLDRHLAGEIQSTLSIGNADYFVLKWIIFATVCFSALIASASQELTREMASLRNELVHQGLSVRSAILDAPGYPNG